MDAFLDLPDDPAADPTERRSSPRVRLDTEISLASESQFFTGLTRNLSTGGVFVATYRRLPIGCHVSLVLTLPDGELAARGTVCWVRDASADGAPGIGIAFEPLDGDAFRRVEQFCALRDPLLYEGD